MEILEFLMGDKMAISYRRAREQLAKIKRHQSKCLVIHYSCQSLYDDRDGLSPSVANIVVKNLENDQTVSFAAHLVAEKMGIQKEEIDSKYQIIEKKLLEDYYQFVQNHIGDYWIHWNMVNIAFGFEMLAHRYYILTERNAPSIDIDNRINLASILHGIYGDKYIGVPHMQKLMEKNGGVRRDFVLGAEEVELFKQKEFARLHASTVSKVKFFSDVVDLVIDKKLKTDTSSFIVKADSWLDGFLAKVLGIIAVLYTIGDLLKSALKWVLGW